MGRGIGSTLRRCPWTRGRGVALGVAIIRRESFLGLDLPLRTADRTNLLLGGGLEDRRRRDAHLNLSILAARGLHHLLQLLEVFLRVGTSLDDRPSFDLGGNSVVEGMINSACDGGTRNRLECHIHRVLSLIAIDGKMQERWKHATCYAV